MRKKNKNYVTTPNPYKNIDGGITRTLRPTVTGGSTIGIVYKDGIMVANDTLASYGNMSRYVDVSRIHILGKRTIFASSGELSDFQKICNILNEEVKKDWAYDDDFAYDAHHYSSFLSRILYMRRNNINPLWTSNVLCGYIEKRNSVKNKEKGVKEEENKLVPYLSYVDLYGTLYEDKCVATGLGRYFALTLLRKMYKPDLTESEARLLIEECMRILYYRDTLASRRIQIAIATPSEIRVEKPIILDTKWDYNDYVRPTTGMSLAGCSW